MNTLIFISVLVLLNCGLWVIYFYRAKRLKRVFTLSEENTRFLMLFLDETLISYREELDRLKESNSAIDYQKFQILYPKYRNIWSLVAFVYRYCETMYPKLYKRREEEMRYDTNKY